VSYLYSSSGLGVDIGGIIGAAGNIVSSAFSAAANIEARRTEQQLLSEYRSETWNETVAQAVHQGRLSELQARLRQEEWNTLQEMEIEARQERLDRIHEQQRQINELQRAEDQERRRRSMQRLPSWALPVLGVGVIGGTLAFVAWRAGR
jgi:phage-related minor tail protein